MKQEYTYKVQELGLKDSTILNDKDKELVESYHLGIQSFNPDESRLDVTISDLDDNVLETYVDSSDYTVRGVMQGSERINQIEVDPTLYFEDRTFLGNQIIVEYKAFNNLYGKGADLYLVNVSSDRTEVQVKSISVSPRDIQYYTTKLQSNLNNQSYFSEALLEVDGIGQIPIVNALVEVLDSGIVATFKLYEPLPVEVELKTICRVLESLGESSRFLVKQEILVTEDPVPELKGPNFAVEVGTSTIATDYKNYTDLLSQKSWESSKGLYTAFKQSSLHTSIDYTDFSDFIHFSSAAERLENARYKFELIFNLKHKQDNLQELGRDVEAQQIADEIDGIIDNFDHYETYLWFEEGPYAWPKKVDEETGLIIRPYIPEDNPLDYEDWYENLFQEAERYDNVNKDLLINTIPTLIREDLDHNEPYILFIDMLGQHFDDLWVYARAITDRYKGDNRPDFGISKELVKEALESFGINLYETNQNLNGLFELCQPDGTYDSGLEVYVNKFRSARCPYTRSNDFNNTGSFVTGSWETGSIESDGYELNSSVPQPLLAETYTKEVYKRIYHNIPVLLKTRGTSRGLRVLLNSFGIPNDILKFKVQGGVSTQKRPFFGPEESIQISPEFESEVLKPCTPEEKVAISGSFDKIRLVETPQITEYKLDSGTFMTMSAAGPITASGMTTGSFFTQSVLSRYTPTTASHQTLTDDLHKVEVGFDLNEAVNTLFSKSLGETDFTVDDVIGDPRNRLEHYGDPWKNLRESLVSGSLASASAAQGDIPVQYQTPASIIRFVRYFDTAFFRMLQEFIPARASINSGVIIKDNFLHRNRWKGVDVSCKVIIESGHITGSQITASHGGSFRYAGEKMDTGEDKLVSTGDKWVIKKVPSGSREINGELQGTVLQVTNGELNDENPDKKAGQPANRYNINVWFLDLPDIPLCSSKLVSDFYSHYWEFWADGGSTEVVWKHVNGVYTLTDKVSRVFESGSGFTASVQTHWKNVPLLPSSSKTFMGWFSGSVTIGNPVTAYHYVDLTGSIEGPDYRWIAAYRSESRNTLWFTTIRPSGSYYYAGDLMISWKYLPSDLDPETAKMSDSSSVWVVVGGNPKIVLANGSTFSTLQMPDREIFGTPEGYFWVGLTSMNVDKFLGVKEIAGKTGPFIKDGKIVDAQWISAFGDWPQKSWYIVTESRGEDVPRPNPEWQDVNYEDLIDE